MNDTAQKPILAVMIGVSGSGKSTMGKKIADYMGATIANMDDIRQELTGNASDQTRNHEVFGIFMGRIEHALRAGKNVVADATNVDKRSRKPFIKAAQRNGAEARAYVMTTPTELAKVLNSARNRVVPGHVIDRQDKAFQMPDESEGFSEVVKVGQNDDVSKFVKLNDK
jgi:predicted kinase